MLSLPTGAHAQSHQIVLEHLGNAGLPFIDRTRLRTELELQHRKERQASDKRHDSEIQEIRQRYRLSSTEKQQRVADFRDFVYANTAHREDAGLALRVGLPDPGFDPILTHLPQVRRRRDSGWLVYEVPEFRGLAGSRELLRCNASEIVVRGSDDDRVRAALLIASRRYSPPLQLTGSETFVSRATAIATELGINIATKSTEQERPRIENVETSQKTAQTGNPEPEEFVTPEAAEDEPDFSLLPKDERLKDIAQECGVSFAATTTSQLIRGSVVDRKVDFWPSTDALIVQLNPMSVAVVPIVPATDVALGSQIDLRRCDDGRFSVSARRPECDREPQLDEVPEAEHELEISASRGHGR